MKIILYICTIKLLLQLTIGQNINRDHRIEINLSSCILLNKKIMKKFLLSVVALLFVTSTFAQTAEKAIKQYGFWDNWFIQLQGGVSENVSDNYERANIMKLLSPVVTIGVGKYFSPEVGARIQFTAGQARNKYITKSINDYYHTSFIGGNLDALFNFTNIFGQYKENRVFNLVGIMGLGFEYGLKRDADSKGPEVGHTRTLSPRFGLQGNFRLCEAWNFNIETNANFDTDNFNGIVSHRKYDVRLNILAGFTYKFPTRGFKVLSAVDPSTISALNDKINAQRQEIENLQNQLKNQPTPQTNTQIVTKTSPAVIIFKIGKSIIEENQKAALYNFANGIKANGQKVTIIGYADKGTGSPERNMKLSQDRAEVVSKALQEYGIDSNNITTEAKGDTEQPFINTNDWNRVVILASTE